MAEDKREAERLGGEYMVQDRDHMGDAAQVGGKASHGSRQSEQSQGGAQLHDSGQQGGERSRRRSKLL